MNILYVLNSGNPGGMEQHVLDLVAGMLASGNSVWVWCPEGDFVEEYKKVGAQVTSVGVGFDIDPKYIFKLASFIRAQKIDIVHAHELKAVINALIAGKLGKVPVISHTHTPISEWQISSWKRKLNVLIYSLFVNLLSASEVALTESRKRVKIDEGIKAEKLAIIPNAVEIEKLDLLPETREKFRLEIRDRYKISQNAYVFGFISRISAEKGHSVLVSAYKKFKDILVAKNIPDESRLFIGGGGALEDDLKQRILDLGLENSVVITGRFVVEDKQKFYAGLNSFVFPTLAEGFGIVLIEAMANFLPVICSDLEVLQEVGGSAVRYFETGNHDDLAEKMVDMYVRADQYDGLANQGLQRVKDLYSMEGFIAKYLDLYNKVLEK